MTPPLVSPAALVTVAAALEHARPAATVRLAGARLNASHGPGGAAACAGAASAPISATPMITLVLTALSSRVMRTRTTVNDHARSCVVHGFVPTPSASRPSVAPVRQTTEKDGSQLRIRSAAVAALACAALGAAQPAAAAEKVLVDEHFGGGVVPAGWTAVLGDWRVVDGRLQATTGNPRARIAFGPTAPAAFRLEATVRFVTVTNAARWLNFGVDYHAAADYGAVVVARSGTTASNGLELAQAAQGGSYCVEPGRPRAGRDRHGAGPPARSRGARPATRRQPRRPAGDDRDQPAAHRRRLRVRHQQLDGPVRRREGDRAATRRRWRRPRRSSVKLSELADTATLTVGGASIRRSPISHYEVAVGDGGLAARGRAHPHLQPACRTPSSSLRVRAVNDAGVAGPAASVRTLRGCRDGQRLQARR